MSSYDCYFKIPKRKKGIYIPLVSLIAYRTSNVREDRQMKMNNSKF